MSDHMPFAANERTIVQISEGNGNVPLLEIHQASLMISPDAALYIDGVRWAVVRRRVDVNTAAPQTITTTITVVRYAED